MQHSLTSLPARIHYARRFLDERAQVYRGWHAEVKQLLVVLTSPRSGSSYLVELLRQHPEIVTPEGEIEPYWLLTEQGYPWTSTSDRWEVIPGYNKLEAFRDYLGLDLLCPIQSQRWQNRFALQYPEVADSYAPGPQHATYADSVRAMNLPVWHDGEPQSKILYREDRDWRLEEPPFIHPLNEAPLKQARDLDRRWLLIKNPADVYRPLTTYLAAFPSVEEVVVIHLTRHAGATMNGLLSGWEHPNGFWSKRLPDGSWWCFCLPPDYETAEHDWGSRVGFQWGAAHETILSQVEAGKIAPIRLSYERLVEAPNTCLTKLWKALRVESYPVKLPGAVMATDRPDPNRWRKQRPELITAHPRIKTLNARMGYSWP